MADYNYGPAIIESMNRKRLEDLAQAEKNKANEPNLVAALSGLLSSGLSEGAVSDKGIDFSKFISPNAIASGIKGGLQPVAGNVRDVFTGLGANYDIKEAARAADLKNMLELIKEGYVPKEQKMIRQTPEQFMATGKLEAPTLEPLTPYDLKLNAPIGGEGLWTKPPKKDTSLEDAINDAKKKDFLTQSRIAAMKKNGTFHYTEIPGSTRFNTILPEQNPAFPTDPLNPRFYRPNPTPPKSPVGSKPSKLTQSGYVAAAKSGTFSDTLTNADGEIPVVIPSGQIRYFTPKDKSNDVVNPFEKKVSSGSVRMKRPDGQLIDVKPENVEKAKAAGYIPQ